MTNRNHSNVILLLEYFDLSLFCSGILKRKMPSGGNQQQINSLHDEGGQQTLNPAAMPCLDSYKKLCLVHKIVRVALLQA